MSYEQKARDGLAALRALPDMQPCASCFGQKMHDPNCPALLEAAAQPGDVTIGEPLTLEQWKAIHVARVLREKNWNKTAAAKSLAIDRRTLYRLIESYGIQVPPCAAK